MSNKKRISDNWMFEDCLLDPSGRAYRFHKQTGGSYITAKDYDTKEEHVFMEFNIRNLCAEVRLGLITSDDRFEKMQARKNAFKSITQKPINAYFDSGSNATVDWLDFDIEETTITHKPLQTALYDKTDCFLGKHTTGMTPITLQEKDNEYWTICKFCGTALEKVSLDKTKEKDKW